MSWIISGNHIAVHEGDMVGHLEAVDIYDALQNGNLTFCGRDEESPEKAFPDMDFSPISRSAVIRLSSDGSNIFLDVECAGIPVDFVHGKLVDQITDGKSWHYIDNANNIREILDGTGASAGRISVSVWLAVLKNGADTGLVINEVDTDALKRATVYHQPYGLKAKLFSYQKIGAAWMDYMLDNVHGCILGDEMGLGKTLQAIVLIRKRANESKKTLVIAPVSLLENWKEECAKFAPDLRVLIHHGNGRTGSPAGFDGYDVVVTSYGHAVTDNLLFCQKEWDLMALDEAQNIKNPYSNRAKAIKQIPAAGRLAITGTPFENHMTDVWSIADFVLPGYLGGKEYFEARVSDDVNGARQVEPVLSSIMIRRLVKDVGSDLPDRIDIPRPLTMSEAEADAYEKTRKDLQAKGITQLPAIQKLRMYCTHPEVYDDGISGDPAKLSVKYQHTCEILEEIFESHEKVLIFTSYQKMFDIFMRDIPLRFGVPADFINGITPVIERQKKVDKFNNHKGSALLVLNPKAAGTGLNITAANHVIHYNPEWNPAVEDQASARAYRRGQTKTTFIYRLYYSGTVEEIINERIERKRRMAGAAVVGTDGTGTDMQDIIKALDISPEGNKNDYRNRK